MNKKPMLEISLGRRGGGGLDFPYETGGDARRKF